MAAVEVVKQEYGTQAKSYDDYLQLPLGTLESQLFAAALGDASNQTVLDLGGGTGLKARQALEAGAASVDVVDISEDMMKVGQAFEAKIGRDQIRWLQADASKPLDYLGLKSYDIVMANWLLDHAIDDEALEGMWKNIAAYLKPGGRFLSVRSGDPRAPAVATGKYGVLYKDVEDVPGGVELRYVLQIESPVDIAGTLRKVSYSGSTEMHQRFGLADIEVQPYEDLECIREDPEFWKLFLDQPSLAVVKARKRAS